ncbi:MAG: hypothetical protein WBP45_08755 [Daejeonella sp.]
MAKSNLISATFSQTDKQAALTKIEELKILMPFLIALTKTERKNLRKMGPKSVNYVQQCLIGAQTFPDELKRSFDTPEMEKDFNLISNLLAVQIACQSMVELISDTMMAAGIDVMAAADQVYESLKISAKNNASVKTMVQKIAERYSGQSGQKTKNSDISQ